MQLQNQIIVLTLFVITLLIPPLVSFRKLYRVLQQILDCIRCFQDSVHLFLKEWASFQLFLMFWKITHLIKNTQSYLCWKYWLYDIPKGSCKCGAKQLGSADLSNADGQSSNGQPHVVFGEICESRKQTKWCIFLLKVVISINTIILIYFFLSLFVAAWAHSSCGDVYCE